MLVTVGAVIVAALLWPELGILQLLTHFEGSSIFLFRKMCDLPHTCNAHNQTHQYLFVLIVDYDAHLKTFLHFGEFPAKCFHNQLGKELTQAFRETEQALKDHLIITPFKSVVRFCFHIIY